MVFAVVGKHRCGISQVGGGRPRGAGEIRVVDGRGRGNIGGWGRGLCVSKEARGLHIGRVILNSDCAHN